MHSAKLSFRNLTPAKLEIYHITRLTHYFSFKVIDNVVGLCFLKHLKWSRMFTESLLQVFHKSAVPKLWKLCLIVCLLTTLFACSFRWHPESKVKETNSDTLASVSLPSKHSILGQLFINSSLVISMFQGEPFCT